MTCSNIKILPSPVGVEQAQLSVAHFFPRIRREEGGVVQVVLDLCQFMASAGHRVILSTCDATDIPAEWKSPQHNPSITQLAKSKFIGSRLSREGVHQFGQLLEGVDVVHFHTPWELSNLQLAAVVRKKKLPYIVSVHGMLDDYCMRQKGLKKRAFLAIGGRAFFAKATTVHFTAEAEKKQACPWIPGDYLPVVQACALDLEPYQSLPGPELALAAFPQLATPKQKILFLSRLHPKKGVELLLEAGGILRAQNRNFELIIAGPGEADYVQRLKKLATQLGLQDSTHFLGMVRGEIKLSLYELADVFVLPTHQENFGLVLPEALACGTPVVTTRGTDIWRELAEAGAKIVENRPAELARAIAELLDDDQLRARLGAQGRHYVQNWLAQDKVLAGYEQMYRDTIRRAAKR
jgi:glycosyltransferase involved in cell wall biosynthesis